MRTRRLPLLMMGWSLFLSGCSLTPKFERPILTVIGVEMVTGNLLQQNLRVKLHIENPNDRSIPVTALHASVKVGGEQIAQGQNDRAFVVPAKGEIDFDMMITANMALAMIKLANKMNQHADSIDYELTGSATLDSAFVHELPFHQAGSFTLKALH
ncbi:MAG TPA: LEA type 2 family protein [Steroidobacteraceae bacterium]|nr:LEA type 2 family protein [Steroidobacteraceae bacterium]